MPSVVPASSVVSPTTLVTVPLSTMPSSAGDGRDGQKDQCRDQCPVVSPEQTIVDEISSGQREAAVETRLNKQHDRQTKAEVAIGPEKGRRNLARKRSSRHRSRRLRNHRS